MNGVLRATCALLVLATAAALALLAPGSATATTRCDPLDPAHCLLPWPNDYFCERGQLALRPEMMPRNSAGTPIEPSDYNRSARTRATQPAGPGPEAPVG